MNCKEFCEKYKGWYVTLERGENQTFEVVRCIHEATAWNGAGAVIELKDKMGYLDLFYFRSVDQSSISKYTNKTIKDMCNLINLYRKSHEL